MPVLLNCKTYARITLFQHIPPLTDRVISDSRYNGASYKEAQLESGMHIHANCRRKIPSFRRVSSLGTLGPRTCTGCHREVWSGP